MQKGVPFSHCPSPASFIRTTEFSRERCSSTSVKVQLVHRADSVAAHYNQGSKGAGPRATTDRSSLDPSQKSVSLLHASDQVTLLPATKATPKVRQILIKCLHRLPSSPKSRPKSPLLNGPPLPLEIHQICVTSVSPLSNPDGKQVVAMPLPVALHPHQQHRPSPSSHSSASSCPSVRPIRVAQPPPLMTTAFPSSSLSSTAPALPGSISVPSLIHKPIVPIHRSIASASTMPAQNCSRVERERFSKMSYEELLELSRNQQRQIETNEAELDERRKAVALFGVAKRTGNETEQQRSARILMANLRAQIAQDEQELTQASASQREAKQLWEHNQHQSGELAQLEMEYAHNEEQLRKTVTKVDSLRRQLELLYQRRAAAADAAIVRQRRINGEGNMVRAERRPKASVVPFKQENPDSKEQHKEKVHRQQHGEEEPDCQPKKTPSEHLLPPSPSHHGQAPINWRKPNPQVDQFSIRRNSMTSLKRLSWAAENGGAGDEYLLNWLLNEWKKGRTVASFGGIDKERESLEREKPEEKPDAVMRPAKLSISPIGDQLDVPLLDDHRAAKDKKGSDDETPKSCSPTKSSGSGAALSPTKSPMSKRMQDMRVCEFNEKFASKIGSNEKLLEEVEEQVEGEAQERVEEIEEETKQNEAASPTSSSASSPCPHDELIPEEEERQSEGGGLLQIGDGEQMLHELERQHDVNIELLDDDDDFEEGQSPRTVDSPTDGSSISEEELPIALDYDVVCTKGILRSAGKTSEVKKRVMFDLIVLFLDVACEGQYELLVELASKIDNISAGNSEGITALHYAICASKLDIVKFLIERGADVNALDVDGWSPLHCAATGNNLVMLRHLVENGACPYATTLSNSETAAQLFDESSDYAASADYLDLVEDCMGGVNDRKVYAAYSYEAEREDELSFAEGDELRVLRKCEEEVGEGGTGEEEERNRLWWLCENCVSGRQGLVPRNYLSLYPTWKFRSRYPVGFELPQLVRQEQQTPLEQQTQDGSSDLIQILSGYGNSEQLSTYA